MAGAGYKLFNTGDVLTAAQVNTYLNEQTVMVFADATARTTALSGVLAEGMVTYLKDTDAVEKYNGSAWVSIGGSASPLTTKGDLYTYSTTDARIAVGNSGDTLLADSSQTTGLRWGSNLGFTAGKNKFINGDFNINQRAFTSTTTAGVYTFDRWLMSSSGGTVTCSAETFTLGTAPVAGYEAKSYVRLVSASQSASSNFASILQKIESVRSFAGQTATISFWAKASTGTPKIGVAAAQNFGTGGSPSSEVVTSAGSVTISTSWTRYSLTVAIPSISGKTLGTASDNLYIQFFTSLGTDYPSYGNIGLQNVTIDMWGFQIESGSVATAFQTATGTLAGELAACQRYYLRCATGNTVPICFGAYLSATLYEGSIFFPVEMRTTPNIDQLTGTNYYITSVVNDTMNSLTIDLASSKFAVVYNNTQAAGTTSYGMSTFLQTNNASAYLGFSAEL